MRRIRKTQIILALFVVGLISVGLVNKVSAATIQPSSASGLLNMPASFTASGLDTTGAEAYSVKLAGVTVLTGLYANSQGELTFQVTPTSAGTKTVAVYNSSSVLECSASLVVTDLFAVIVPVMVLFIGLSILFGIAKEMGEI